MRTDDQGFSLVELLVVMIIIAILGAISWSGFVGMRTTMTLHQTAKTFRSDVVYAQRSAMLLNRSPEDNWIWGIGVDLNQLVAEAADVPDITLFPARVLAAEGDGVGYSLFKWCSTSLNYEDFNPVRAIPQSDGWESAYDLASCRSGHLFPLPGYYKQPLVGGTLDVCVTAYPSGTALRYIVFESITGRVHFYDEAGAPQPDSTAALVTFYRGGKYDSIRVTSSGEIGLYTYDPDVRNPCLPSVEGNLE